MRAPRLCSATSAARVPTLEVQRALQELRERLEAGATGTREKRRRQRRSRELTPAELKRVEGANVCAVLRELLEALRTCGEIREAVGLKRAAWDDQRLSRRKGIPPLTVLLLDLLDEVRAGVTLAPAVVRDRYGRPSKVKV